jgi:hypothetical protein
MYRHALLQFYCPINLAHAALAELGSDFKISQSLAYYGHEPPLRVNATCMMYVKAWAYYKGADGMAEAEIP